MWKLKDKMTLTIDQARQAVLEKAKSLERRAVL